MAHLNSLLKTIGWWALYLLLCAPSAHAIRTGKAHLYITHLNPSPQSAQPQPGDLLHLALKVDAQNETITGVAVYLTLDSDHFELIPAREAPILQPFRKGTWLQGNVHQNSTLGDKPNDPLANKRPGFQMAYNEDRPGRFDGPRTGISGTGILAEFSVRLLKAHPNPLHIIQVDHQSQTGDETGYFNQNLPGTLFSLTVKTQTSLVGDFNDDQVCDFKDFLLFVQAYSHTPHTPNYSARYDLDGNFEVGLGDFIIFSQAFQK